MLSMERRKTFGVLAGLVLFPKIHRKSKSCLLYIIHVTKHTLRAACLCMKYIYIWLRT